MSSEPSAIEQNPSLAPPSHIPQPTVYDLTAESDDESPFNDSQPLRARSNSVEFVGVHIPWFEAGPSRRPPHRAPHIPTVEADSDDEIVQVDRRGRVVPQVPPLILPGVRDASSASQRGASVRIGNPARSCTFHHTRSSSATETLLNSLHFGNPFPSDPDPPTEDLRLIEASDISGLRILDPAPVPRPIQGRPSNSPLPQSTRQSRLGGALFTSSASTSDGTRRRRIGYRIPYAGGSAVEDGYFGFGPGLTQLFNTFVYGGNGPETHLDGIGGILNHGRHPQADVPPFNPRQFGNRGKLPRPGFTFDFDHPASPSSSPWIPISSSSPSSSFPSSIAAVKNYIFSHPTHPKRKAKDPAPEEVESSSAGNLSGATPSPSLVCASCSKSLMLGLEGDDRIWALRCGHIICGGCLGRIGLPPAPSPLVEAHPSRGDIITPDTTEMELVSPSLRKLDKGKGKAREVDDDFVSAHRIAHPLLHQDREVPQPSNIETSNTNLHSERAPRTRGRGGARGRKKGRSGRLNKKSKGKAPLWPPETRILREWSFRCPVTDCGMEHVRELVTVVSYDLETREEIVPEGSWRPKEGSGEVAIYT